MERVSRTTTAPNQPGEICEIADGSAERVLCWARVADGSIVQHFVRAGETCVLLETDLADDLMERFRLVFSDGSVGVRAHCIIHHVKTGARLYTRRSNLKKVS